jgi:hypothetical protein
MTEGGGAVFSVMTSEGFFFSVIPAKAGIQALKSASRFPNKVKLNFMNNKRRFMNGKARGRIFSGP